MKDNYNIGFVDVGGWDTHVGEGGATGYIPRFGNSSAWPKPTLPGVRSLP